MRTFLKIVGVLTLIVGCLGLFYWASVAMGPTRDILGLFRTPVEEVVLTEEEIAAMEAEVSALEASFRDALRVRALSEEDLAVMEEAIALQQEVVDARRRDAVAEARLEDLERFFADQSAQRLIRESERLEDAARQDDLPAGELAAAADKLEEAARLQEQVNREFGNTPSASLQRLLRLDREVSELRARPTYDASIAAEAAAEEALAAEDWDAAAAYLEEAIATQSELNSSGGNAAYENVTRLAELERELASLQSRDLAEQIDSLSREARRLVENEGFRSAAERLRLAIRLQEELNRDFAGSRFAGERLRRDLESRLLQANSASLAGEILSESETLDAQLREGQVIEALANIGNLARKVEVFRTEFPESTRVSRELQAKVEYLAFIRSEAGFFQRRIESQLLPVPSVEGIRMLRTEVSQALYTSIMLNNPSRRTGETLPVESVTYEEAEQFCQRVGWIFGRTIRLPRREEIEAAVGSLRYVNLTEQAWCRQNASGSIQPIATREANAHGFHDLLGNVSEWCQPSGFLTSTEALLAGGAATDSIDRLAEIPFDVTSQRSRNRFTGFRLVLDDREVSAAPVAESPDATPPS